MMEQDHKCRICKIDLRPLRTNQIHVDHKGRIVRGILCANCNTGLGKFMDSPDLLDSAAEYLRITETVSI
jgi:hypothetical protein